MLTTISLVRHGLVENPRRVYYGRLPGFALAAEGREQAAAAGLYLAGEDVAAIYHSPMERATETAAIVGAGLARPAPLAECPLLNEIHSADDGRPVDEMKELDWNFYRAVSPPYETPADVLARVVRFFDFARQNHPGQHIVGVSHADPIAFAVMWGCGLPPSADERKRLEGCGIPEGYPAPASVSTFTFDAAGGNLIGFHYICPYTPSHED